MMEDFKFPTNIKQIGSIGQGIKIYVEDYVYSYLQQYSKSSDYEERIALLIGRHLTIDGHKVLFISGAVQGIHTKTENGITVFTEKSWAYAREQIKKYFKGLEIIGSVLSQPGYGTFLNSTYAKYHLDNFPKEYQVMFIMDPKDKINAFYISNEPNNLVETKGYFIYFEKNHGMHEYMLNNKIINLNADKNIDNKFKVFDSFNNKNKELDEHEQEYADEVEEIKEIEKPKFINSKNNKNLLTLPEKNIKTRVTYAQRRKINMLASLSAVLFFVTFIMGAALIQNEDRISTLESQLTLLNTSYRNLLVRLNENNSQPVFSQQEDESTSNDSNAELILENGNDILSSINTFQQENLDTSEQIQDTEHDIAAEIQSTETSDVNIIIETQTIETSSTSTAIPEYYTVEQGDSLGYISIKFYGDRSKMQEIMELNDIEDPDKLFFGKRLKLPRR